jgi:SpoVK/Ycf46/Vps4 family AAA+-type ATPase
MDGMNAKKTVFIFGVTNRSNIIDLATLKSRHTFILPKKEGTLSWQCYEKYSRPC